MSYVYILKCKDNAYYVGATKNKNTRLKNHNCGRVKYTKSRLPVKLIFLKKFEKYGQALSFEKRIKSWKKRSSIEKMLDKDDNLVRAPSSNG